MGRLEVEDLVVVFANEVEDDVDPDDVEEPVDREDETEFEIDDE